MTPDPASSEYLDAYNAVGARLAEIVTARCDTPVPACPGWRVHEVIAHLAGVCEDWVSHRLEGYATETWTAHHVARHADDTCDEILDGWADAMTSFAQLENSDTELLPARWAFGDAVVHEADIRGAIAADRVPNDAVLLALQATLARWQREVLTHAGICALHVRTPAGPDWWLGTANDPDALLLEVPIYDLFRALAGRRTKGQVREWSWSADPEPVIEAGLPYPFRWASVPVDD